MYIDASAVLQTPFEQVPGAKSSYITKDQVVALYEARELGAESEKTVAAVTAASNADSSEKSPRSQKNVMQRPASASSAPKLALKHAAEDARLSTPKRVNLMPQPVQPPPVKKQQTQESVRNLKQSKIPLEPRAMSTPRRPLPLAPKREELKRSGK